MTKGITGREPDPRDVYRDIIDLPHHVSEHHPQMSLYDRAAQFAPYAALVGYHDMVGEEARLVDQRIELSDEMIARLNQKLNRIARSIAKGERPIVSITYFLPDALKDGGRYETVTEQVRKVDVSGQRIILEKRTGIAGSYMEIRTEDVLEIYTDQMSSDR